MTIIALSQLIPNPFVGDRRNDGRTSVLLFNRKGTSFVKVANGRSRIYYRIYINSKCNSEGSRMHLNIFDICSFFGRTVRYHTGFVKKVSQLKIREEGKEVQRIDS